MPAVLAQYKADTVWFSAIAYTNYTVTNFLNSVRWQGKEVIRPANGTVFDLGGATITVLGPIRDNHEDVNDISLVLMVQYGDVRFLLTGDMESIAEKELVESGADLKADVLKVGHHGSYSSTCYIFLREVMPTYAVISLALGNEYGHPHDEPMSRLRDAGAIIFQTGKMYNIAATTDGTNISFKWDNKYAEPWTPSK
jgi:competence protein ComEC